MSEMLERTWSFLTSSGSAPKWTVPSNQSSSTSHLPHGLSQFMKSVCQAPTSVVEAALVQKQLKAVQTKLQEPNLSNQVLSDCIVRAMLCHILGYSVDFAHIYALQLAQKGSITEKKIGYLAAVMFINENDDLILLLINTILRDLKSTNLLENNMALVTAAYLVPKEMSGMILPILVEKANHSKDFIRKKSLICLEQVALKNPESIDQVIETIIVSISDQDPGVATVAIQVINTLYTQYPGQVDLTNCLKALCQVQYQILDNKLPKDYQFHGVPAPWAQQTIVQLLRHVNFHNREDVIKLVVLTVDQPSLYAIKSDTAIGSAVLFECIETLSVILQPDIDDQYSHIMRKLMKCLRSLLNSHSGNNLYIGLCAFESLLQNQEKGVLPHISNAEREFVYKCLDHSDDCIRKKAFSLLNALATEENVKDICERILSHVRELSDIHFRNLLIEKTIAVIDKFSETNMDWRVFMMLRMLQCAKSKEQRQKLIYKMQKIFGTRPYDEKKIEIGQKLLSILTAPAQEDHAPDALLELYLWCVSNFGKSSQESCQNIIQIVEKSQFKNESIVKAALKHLFAIVTNDSDADLSTKKLLTQFIEKCCCETKWTKVQDQASELKFLLGLDLSVLKSLESEKDYSQDFTMSYLDEIVVNALERGAPVYDPSLLQIPSFHLNRSRSPSLRFTPYNVMDESEWKSMSVFENNPSSSTTGSLKSPDVVWTMKGRAKRPETDEQEEELVNLRDQDNNSSNTESEIQAAVIQDLSQWS